MKILLEEIKEFLDKTIEGLGKGDRLPDGGVQLSREGSIWLEARCIFYSNRLEKELEKMKNEN